MNDTMALVIFINLIAIVSSFIVIKKRNNKIEELEKDLAYWKYRSKAKDFLLERATLQKLVPTIQFVIERDTFGILRVYKNPKEEPIIIRCIHGDDDNIHEVPLK